MPSTQQTFALHRVLYGAFYKPFLSRHNFTQYLSCLNFLAE